MSEPIEQTLPWEVLQSTVDLVLKDNHGFDGAPYIQQIAEELDKRQIPYIRNSVQTPNDQLLFPWCEANVVCHYGSYGHEKGLFEVVGDKLMTQEEIAIDSVKGKLPLDVVVERIVKAYDAYRKENNE